MAEVSKPSPLTETAMAGMSRDANGVWVLSPDGFHALERAFSDVVAKGSDVAIPAIRELANFAFFLEKQQKSPEAAQTIYGVINTLKQVIASHGLELKHVRPESRQESASRFLGLPKVSPPGLPKKEDNEDPSAETFKPWAVRNK